MSHDPERSDASQISTDRESIRAWADEHEATPLRHREEGAYRLAEEDRAGEAHEPADWDEFHSHLEENEQVVIYHGETGDQPFEVTHREDAISRSNVSDDDLQERLMAGDTVTSTITETAVVEEVIVEEATIESELVDTEITDDRVIDAELVSRECTNCQLEETGTVDAGEWFDADRYLSSTGDPGDAQWGEGMAAGTTADRNATGEAGATSTEPGTTSTEPSTTDSITTEDRSEGAEAGTPVTDPVETDASEAERAGRAGGTEGTGTAGGTERTGTAAGTEPGPMTTDRTYSDVDEEYPYTAELDVEEAWSVTRELTERYTVESRVADVDVAETDSIEERDIDVEGLQRNLAESDLVDFDLSADELLEESEVETEFTEDDRIETHFTNTRIVEDEVVDRQHVRAEVTGATERSDFERIRSMDVADETTEETDAADTTAPDEGVDTPGTGAGTDDEVMEDSAAMGTASGAEAGTGDGDLSLSQDEVGKDVVDADGERIGLVTDVSEDGRTMFVDAHPGITDRIKAALDWGGADDDDYPVEVTQVDDVTREAITLKGTEELEEVDSPTP